MPALIPAPRLEISLDNLLHNLAGIRSCIPAGTGIIAVVKDSAYGCGSRLIARTLEENGVNFFAVARAAEAFFLRKNKIASPILVLGPATSAEVKKGWRNNLVFTLNDLGDLARWKHASTPVRFHCNIDTRMHRMGIMPHEILQLADALQDSGSLILDGVFTHLANADEPGTGTIAGQCRIFDDALALLKTRNIAPQHIHYANSAGIMRDGMKNPSTLARSGIALYGCKPDPKQAWPVDLRPVVSLKSRVIKLKKVPADTPVSYGGLYVTNRETWIATVTLGYAHGYPRSLTNRGELLINGKRYRIAGTVTMDYCMVDAGPDPAFRVGDEVVAIGVQGGEQITPDDVALLDNTIGYEVLCRLGTSLDRRYFLGGNLVDSDRGRVF
ncbi:MAG: alanine racemase [Chitinispirillaceae bacterium]|nr:alanine racemase [Chitinispirillaceae bacterium]